MSAKVREGALDDRVRDQLAGLDDVPTDLVILPTGVRTNGVWYSLDDVNALKVARTAGLDARLADDAPTYLHEYSAGWAADLALAIIGDVRSTAVGAVAVLVWARARQAIRSGTATGSEERVPLKLSITRRHATATSVVTDTLELEGSTRDVLEALPEALRRLDPGAPEFLAPPDMPERPLDGSDVLNVERSEPGPAAVAAPDGVRSAGVDDDTTADDDTTEAE